MIIGGGSRSNAKFFSMHLMKAEENERVEVVDIRGLAADDIREAFREMEALASGTRAKNFFYHANINPRAEETLTPEQWDQAIDTLEVELGLEGHSRFVVEHSKDGRTHRHVVWSRIDVDSMTAVSDSKNYAAHERAARALEAAFGHEAVPGVHGRDTEMPRPERRPDNWETFRGHRSQIDPQEVKAELSELWARADSGKAFAAALEERGYVLANGDKRDFCVVDQAGDAHSLARRIDGAKAKDIRERLADIDRDALPSVAQAREQIQGQGDTAPATIDSKAPEDGNPAAREQPVSAEEPSQQADTKPAPTAEPPAEQAQGSRQEEAREGQEGASAFDQFASDMKQAMRSNNGEPRMHDGLTWWERVVAVVAIGSLVMDAMARPRAIGKIWLTNIAARVHQNAKTLAETGRTMAADDLFKSFRERVSKSAPATPASTRGQALVVDNRGANPLRSLRHQGQAAPLRRALQQRPGLQLPS